MAQPPIKLPCKCLANDETICASLVVMRIPLDLPLVVLLQHAVLAVKLLVAYAIPDIPTKVAEEKARLEFLRREALKVFFTNSSHLLFGNVTLYSLCSR